MCNQCLAYKSCIFLFIHTYANIYLILLPSAGCLLAYKLCFKKKTKKTFNGYFGLNQALQKNTANLCGNVGVSKFFSLMAELLSSAHFDWSIM